MDFVPEVLYWIQIRTECRPWHDSDVLEKVPGCSGSVGAGIVLLNNVKSKDLIDIPESRDAITSTRANILNDNRLSFTIDPDGSSNHDDLPTPRVSLHHTCICATFTYSSLDPHSANRRRNTEPSFI